MEVKEAVVLLLTKVLLPTIDVFSDWLFGIQLILGWNYDPKCSKDFAESHVNMGIASLVPATLSTFFHVHHWYHLEKVENGGSGRLKTLPTVLLQVWPQYRFSKMVWDGFVKKEVRRSQREKAFLDREISSVEPLVESHWQFNIMLYLCFSSPKCFGISNGLTLRSIYFYLKLVMSYCSMFTGGINFAYHGPLAFTKTRNGTKIEFSPLSPMSILRTVSNIFMALIPFQVNLYIMSLNGGFNLGCSGKITVFIVFGMHLLPPVIFSLTAMAVGIGIVSTLKFVLRYPALITQIMAQCIVYVPVDYESKCLFSRHGKTIQYHHRFTSICSLLKLCILIAIFSLPKNNDVIVTESDDETNVYFGLKLNAKQLNIISIVSFTIGFLLLWLQSYLDNLLYGKFVIESKTYEIKNLDVYTNDISDDEEDSVGVAESTHL